MGSAITNDPDGLDQEHIAGVFNVGYLLFLGKFDKIHPKKRLKSFNITKADDNGTRIDNLVQEGGEDFNEFFEPYDVIRVNDDNEKIEEVGRVESVWVNDKGYYTDLERIYLPNYSVGDNFRVRYVPEPSVIDDSTATTTKIFMPRKYAPKFAQYLAAMQDTIEEEANRTKQAPIVFEQYFRDMGKIYNWRKPQVVTPSVTSIYSSD